MLPTLGRRGIPLYKVRISFFHGQSQSFSVFPSALLLQRLLCNRVTSLLDLKRAHAFVITSGHAGNPFLAAKLISLYSDFRYTNPCAGVFSAAISQHPADAFLWNSIAKAHHSHDDFAAVLRRYGEMRASGARPNNFTIPLVISACAKLIHLSFGSCVHGDALKAGLLGFGSSAAGSSLIYMYSRCQCIGNALNMFDEMPQRDVISWTAIIVGLAMNGDPKQSMAYLRDMQRSTTTMNSRTIVAGLRASSIIEALAEGKCLHALSIKMSSWLCDSVKSSTLSLYSKCASLDDTLAVFQELNTKDLVSWTEILYSHAKLGLVRDCTRLFCSMLDAGVKPDGITISCLISSVSSGINLGALHGFLVRRQLLERIGAIGLLEMYCKLDLPAKAITIFNMIDNKDGESWAAILSSLSKIESCALKCMEIFRKMQLMDIGIQSGFDFVIAAISSCSRLKDLHSGLALHCFCIKNELHTETSVSNSLMGMYGKIEKSSYIRKIFNLMKNKDVVTWNTLMAALLRSGKSQEALEVFDQMLSNDVEPNSVTMVIVLSACAAAAALQRGKVAHRYIREKGFDEDIAISTALIDMYAKCGMLSDARIIFNEMGNKDLAAWNAMICGYGGHGYAEEALELMEKMVGEGCSPNEITFIALLSACSRAGLVEDGRRIFGRMGEFSLKPSKKHVACMVDMLGRSGQLEEAEAMAIAAPAADGGVWGALLGACRIHGKVEMGERAGKMAMELDPCNDGYYMVLSNLYSSEGKKNEADRLRKMMLNLGLRKTAGWSMTELDSGRICDTLFSSYKEA